MPAVATAKDSIETLYYKTAYNLFVSMVTNGEANVIPPKKTDTKEVLQKKMAQFSAILVSKL